MIIVENIETVIVQQKTVGKLCNKCGLPFSPHAEDIKTTNTDLGEYGNPKYEICDKCHLEFIKSFAIVPTNFKSSPYFTSSFDLDHDLHQNLFEQWQISGIWNCDEDPWRDYYENYEEYLLDYESYEEYEDVSDAIEVRKPYYV